MNSRTALLFGLMLVVAFPALAQQPPSATSLVSELQQLSSDFWVWRAGEQPFRLTISRGLIGLSAGRRTVHL